MKGVSILSILVLMLAASCQKKPDTFVFVYVEDINGNRVAGASVSLRGQPSDSVYVNKLTMYDLDGVTDAEGKALFRFTEFYQKGSDGFAILGVGALSGTQLGSGLVKLIEAETSEVTIVIQ